MATVGALDPGGVGAQTQNSAAAGSTQRWAALRQRLGERPHVLTGVGTSNKGQLSRQAEQIRKCGTSANTGAGGKAAAARGCMCHSRSKPLLGRALAANRLA